MIEINQLILGYRCCMFLSADRKTWTSRRRIAAEFDVNELQRDLSRRRCDALIADASWSLRWANVARDQWKIRLCEDAAVCVLPDDKWPAERCGYA